MKDIFFSLPSQWLWPAYWKKKRQTDLIQTQYEYYIASPAQYLNLTKI